MPAVGGERTVPSPDEIATEYLLLALRLDHHDPGLVDGYYGPAEIKARTELEQPRSIDRLRADATALLERVATDVLAPDRRTWLEAQLVALECRAAVLGGEPTRISTRSSAPSRSGPSHGRSRPSTPQGQPLTRHFRGRARSSSACRAGTTG